MKIPKGPSYSIKTMLTLKTGTDILLPTISLAALLSSRVSKYIQYEVTWNSMQYGCFEIISFLFIHLFIRFVRATIETIMHAVLYIYIYFLQRKSVENFSSELLVYVFVICIYEWSVYKFVTGDLCSATICVSVT